MLDIIGSMSVVLDAYAGLPSHRLICWKSKAVTEYQNRKDAAASEWQHRLKSRFLVHSATLVN